MKPENISNGMRVRNRRTLAVGFVRGDDPHRRVIMYVDPEHIDGCDSPDSPDIDPVAVVKPVLVQVRCPVCGEASNRKPFTEWVVETCPDCGEDYAAAPIHGVLSC